MAMTVVSLHGGMVYRDEVGGGGCLSGMSRLAGDGVPPGALLNHASPANNIVLGGGGKHRVNYPRGGQE